MPKQHAGNKSTPHGESVGRMKVNKPKNALNSPMGTPKARKGY